MKLIEAIQKDFKHNGKLYKWIPKDEIRVLRKNYWNEEAKCWLRWWPKNVRPFS